MGKIEVKRISKQDKTLYKILVNAYHALTKKPITYDRDQKTARVIMRCATADIETSLTDKIANTLANWFIGSAEVWAKNDDLQPMEIDDPQQKQLEKICKYDVKPSQAPYTLPNHAYVTLDFDPKLHIVPVDADTLLCFFNDLLPYDVDKEIARYTEKEHMQA